MMQPFLTRECEAMNELLEVRDVGVKCRRLPVAVNFR